MRVLVETSAGHGGVEMPRRFRLDGREVEVTNNLDQWHGAQDRYFKLMGDDGNLYILRLDEGRAEWELILFQSPHYRKIAAIPPARKEQGGGAKQEFAAKRPGFEQWEANARRDTTGLAAFTVAQLAAQYAATCRDAGA